MSDPLINPKGWVTREEAARILGKGTRQVERRAAKGLIRRYYLRRGPGERTVRVFFSREDLEALRNGNPANSPTRLTLEDHFPPPRASNHKDQKPWLTVREAAEYSGLPELFLLSSAAVERFGGLDVGGEFRFRREALR